MSRPEGILTLETDSGLLEFPGELMGYQAPTTEFFNDLKSDRGYGEVVFNTSMTGYQEILTDPSYFGEIVVMTVPHIGNTGINTEDVESRKSWVAGFVVHELSLSASNWRSQESLESFLIRQKIPGICRIDTRKLTRLLRSRGVTRGLILPRSRRNEALKLFEKLPRFDGRDLIQEVSTKTPYSWPQQALKNPLFHIVAMDFGIKWNILRSFAALNCQVTVVPAHTSADEILALKPHGLFLSNGPGDPSAVPYAVKTIQNLLGKLPIFGICMGHQLLGIALGGKTYKLKFGHRGGNQPVQELQSRIVAISSHNHGYAVNADSLPPHAIVSHINLNDQCVEGLEIPQLRAFSVQYHPEACPGPHDSRNLFKRFVDRLR